jgi:hypothetical protein
MFCACCSILWGILSFQEQCVAEKYRCRGWKVERFLCAEDLLSFPSELGICKRNVGDLHCWSFNLDSLHQGKSIQDQGCSWSTEYSTMEIEFGQGNARHIEEAFWGRIVVEEEPL